MVNYKEIWDKVRDECIKSDDKCLLLSDYTTYTINNNYIRFIYTLSRYKFAWKMLQNKKTLLEIGCNDGLFTKIFSSTMDKIVGIDFDEQSIAYAKKHIENDKIKFICDDFLKVEDIGVFDSIVLMDVIEHIPKNLEKDFLEKICNSLHSNGIVIIGTPNIESAKYQSLASQIGHINMFDHNRLLELTKNYFSNVFLFSSNDEVVHTGFYPMANYYIAIGVGLLNR